MVRFFLLSLGFAAPVFAQQSTARLEGRVTDINGLALRKAAVSLRAYGGDAARASYHAASDSAGRFGFEGVEPGIYILSAERAGYLPKTYRARPQETMTQLILTAGRHLREINLRLTREARISGRVLDDEGDPVARAEVSLLRFGYQNGARRLMLESSAFTDEAGKYRIDIQASGEYYLAAGTRGDAVFSVAGMRVVGGSKSQGCYSATFYPSAVSESAAGLVGVKTGVDRTGMEIRLRKTPAFAVKGKVEGAVPGHPLEQCRLALMSGERPQVFFGLRNEGMRARLGKDGAFDFDGSLFAPGVYELITSCAPGIGTVVARQRVVIGSQDVGDVVVQLRPLLEIRGVVNVEGEPPGGAVPEVTLHNDDDPMMSSLRGKVKGDSSFVITDVAPGAYQVRLYNIPQGTYLKSVKLGSIGERDAGIEISEMSARNPLQILLSRSVGRIAGLVRTEAGKAARGSVVTLVQDPPGSGNGTTMLSGGDETGRFMLSPVAPGTYRLYAWEDLEMAQHYDPEFLTPYRKNSVAVTVDENGTAQVVVTQIAAAGNRF